MQRKEHAHDFEILCQYVEGDDKTAYVLYCRICLETRVIEISKDGADMIVDKLWESPPDVHFKSLSGFPKESTKKKAAEGKKPTKALLREIEDGYWEGALENKHRQQ
jgi:predicted RNase H-like nuclease